MKKILYFAAACAALVACSKQFSEQPVAFEKGQEVTLSIAAPDRTKMSSELSGTDINFKWEQDDSIKVTVGGSSATFTVSQLYNGGLSASFKGVMPAGGETFDVQFPVEDPVITTQTYSALSPLSHNAMKFTATGCSVAYPEINVSATNAVLNLNLYGDYSISKIVVSDASSNTYTLGIDPAIALPSTEATARAFHIVVPAGTYKFSAEVFDNSATPESVATFIPKSSQNLAAGQILSMPAKEVTPFPYLPSGGLKGVFTINDQGKKVHFSKGNLQYQASTGTWRFAENQRDVIGNAAGNISDSTVRATQSDWIDLFGWGATGYCEFSQPPYGISEIEADYRTRVYPPEPYKDSPEVLTLENKADWGYCMGGATSPWFTLSADEWTYLFNTRVVNGNTGLGYTYEYALWGITIEGIKMSGLVLFPDGFTKQSTWKTEYTTWAAADAAGIVFFPFTGRRVGSEVGDWTVESYCFYWSRISNSSVYASHMINDNNGFRLATQSDRYVGMAVRLVTAVPAQ